MSIGGPGEEQSIGGAGEVITLRSGEEELLTTGTLHTRTLNEGSQRFQNHGEGSYRLSYDNCVSLPISHLLTHRVRSMYVCLA